MRIHLKARLPVLHLLHDAVRKRLHRGPVKLGAFHDDVIPLKERLENLPRGIIHRGHIFLMNINDKPLMLRHFRIRSPMQDIGRDDDDISPV
ncbi:hypothetical protein D3C73_1490220 [compost metagenome]